MSVFRFAALLVGVALPLAAQPSRPSPTVVVASADSTRTRSSAASERERARRDGIPVGWPIGRRQFWVSGSLGRGEAGVACETCRDERTRAFSGDLGVGLTVTPRFVVGVQTMAWLDVIGGGVDRIVRGTQLTARQFPFANYPVFFAGSVGVSSFRLEDDRVRFDQRAPSFEFGVGYHWKIGELLLTPAVHAMAGTGGALKSNETGNAPAPNARLGLWRTTLGVSWYRPLPSSTR
ncbi:MAG: hypothetical protein MUE41_12185 [Gemmatimonadaceae bacterium]|jgi:hypothetical protein|nr:hypothetical protein [Gemmatimonadaceae bacterium]